jgi:hypothetical protein
MTRITATLHADQCTSRIPHSVLLKMRNVSDKHWRWHKNPHCVFNTFYSENRAVYGMRWKNYVETDRPQMTIWRMRSACWVTNATYTYTYTHTPHIHNTHTHTHHTHRQTHTTHIHKPHTHTHTYTHHSHTHTHTHTHTIRMCSTYCFSTAKMVSRTRFYVTLYVQCLSC